MAFFEDDFPNFPVGGICFFSLEGMFFVRSWFWFLKMVVSNRNLQTSRGPLFSGAKMLVSLEGSVSGVVFPWCSRLGMEEDAMVQRLNHMQDEWRWAPMSPRWDGNPPRKWATWEFSGNSRKIWGDSWCIWYQLLWFNTRLPQNTTFFLGAAVAFDEGWENPSCANFVELAQSRIWIRRCFTFIQNHSSLNPTITYLFRGRSVTFREGIYLLGGSFKYFLIVTPKPSGNDSQFAEFFFFESGWFHHQLFFFAVDRGMFRWGNRGQQPFPRFDWVQETIFRNPKLQEEGLDSEAPQRPAENILE